MADTTNATYDGGIDVPLEDFSGANINTISETSKRFPKFNIKNLFLICWQFSMFGTNCELGFAALKIKLLIRLSIYSLVREKYFSFKNEKTKIPNLAIGDFYV